MKKTRKKNLKLSGSYTDTLQTNKEKIAQDTELELRVDIDGKHPLNIISGDLYSNAGGTHNYINSFRFEKIEKIKTLADEIKIIGKEGKFYSEIANFTRIQVTLYSESDPLKAEIKLINKTGLESKYLCQHESNFFRRVIVEHDYEEDAAPLEPYNTSDLPSPHQHRSRPIGIGEAFAEAGIQMKFLKKKQCDVPHPQYRSLGSSVWTQNELFDAMLKHSSLIKKETQWAVWLFSAIEYVISDYKGTMVLHEGENRRGCAVFQNATGWQSAAEQRMRLFIYIHELGHCFNLRHPWSGIPADSPEKIEAHATLSWMNYPWRYYLSEEIRGEEEFWKRFNFKFSDSELIHLRHGFRNDVIFGGNNKKEI